MSHPVHFSRKLCSALGQLIWLCWCLALFALRPAYPGDPHGTFKKLLRAVSKCRTCHSGDCHLRWHRIMALQSFERLWKSWRQPHSEPLDIPFFMQQPSMYYRWVLQNIFVSIPYIRIDTVHTYHVHRRTSMHILCPILVTPSEKTWHSWRLRLGQIVSSNWRFF